MVKKKYIIAFSTALIFFSSAASLRADDPKRKNIANDDDEKLARVGNTYITKSEFSERYELTPWPRGEKNPNMDMAKRDFLNTLIAEKLWAQKAQKLNMDTSEVMRYSYKTLEKMYVRDALYKLEISSKVKITDKELLPAYFMASRVLKVDYIFSEDKKEIQGTYNLLQKGLSFDSLLAFRGSPDDSLMTVTFGRLDENLEQDLYKLPEGGYTTPFAAPNGYFIFRVKDIADAPINNDKDQKTLMNQTKKIVEARKTDKAYQKFYQSFFPGKKVSANGYVLWSLAEKMTDELKNVRQRDTVDEGTDIHLRTAEFMRIEQKFGKDSLDVVLIEFKKDPVSLKQFLRDLMFEGFYSKSTDPAMIRAKLNARVKRYIENEMLVREGYKRGLQNLPEVQKDLKMWREFYLSQLYRNTVLDSSRADDNEARQYFESRNHAVTMPVQVNIVEILTDSLEVVEKILNESANTDFKELARRYSKREETRASSGEFGLFAVTEHGELGRIAATMKVGDIYGPVKLPEGYSIFKLIDKKEESVAQTDDFEKVKNSVKQNLYSFKYQRNIVNYTAKLADEMGVTINEDAMTKLQLNNLTMIAYRYMGFGGRITAVPIMAPFYQWTEVWQEKKKDLP